jgi:ABC-2 type transport system ATP-binding protein
MERLTKKFNDFTAVDNIDLQVRKGELFSLLGPNGAGKTTTIRMLCCQIKLSSGKATISGYDVSKEPFDVKKIIGVSPQDTVLSERLNCWENLSLMGKTYSMTARDIRRRSQELLETMGLIDRAKDRVTKLSGGMKRRLSIAMALIHDPEVVFLDEPTLGLDPQARRAIWDYIAVLKGEKTVLLTTHYMEEADSLSDRIAIIDHGRIVALGTSAKIKAGFITRQSMLISADTIDNNTIAALQNHYAVVERVNGDIRIADGHLDLKTILDDLMSHGIKIYSAALEKPTLEDVFLQITGKNLRDQ